MSACCHLSTGLPSHHSVLQAGQFHLVLHHLEANFCLKSSGKTDFHLAGRQFEASARKRVKSEQAESSFSAHWSEGCRFRKACRFVRPIGSPNSPPSETRPTPKRSRRVPFGHTTGASPDVGWTRALSGRASSSQICSNASVVGHSDSFGLLSANFT